MHYTHSPKKRWGQHFLQEPERLEICLEMMEIQAGDQVLEIGPGPGVLTGAILERDAHVEAIEIDADWVQELQKRWGDEPRFCLKHQDIQDYDCAQFAPQSPWKHRKVMANIPYYLSTPLLHQLLNAKVWKQRQPEPQEVYFSAICLLVQREVGLKMAALPGTPAWGQLSILVQLAAQVVWIDDVPRSAFYPPPQVDSALVMLLPRHEAPIPYADGPNFWKLVEKIFQMRRKNLRNVLRNLNLSDESITTLGQDYDLQRRGETFSLEELSALQIAISKV